MLYPPGTAPNDRADVRPWNARPGTSGLVSEPTLGFPFLVVGVVGVEV